MVVRVYEAFKIKSDAAVKARDWPRVASVYYQYGCCLELGDYTLPMTAKEVHHHSKAVDDLVKGI